MVTLEDLLTVEIFKDLPPENLTALIPHLTERKYSANVTVIYRGDPGYSMFMVINGQVAVTQKNDEGVEYTLATLEKGDIFGEMALMTGEPRSANVKTLTQTRLFELNQEAFFELVATYPALNESLLRLLVQRRSKTAVQQAVFSSSKSNVAALFAQPAPDVEELVGKTKWTSETNATIAELAQSFDNILILGERGTGKDLAARLIHHSGASRDEPLFHLDCANPPPVQRAKDKTETEDRDALHREIAHTAALFGHGTDAGSYARGIRRGYLELADNGSIILENIDMLATTSLSSQELEESGKIEPELLRLLGDVRLALKPLRERKKDIPVLAEHLREQYARKFGKNVKGFSKGAFNLLVDHTWPLNVDELQQVVERAVVVATGDIIEERQVFLNIPTFYDTGRYNLLRNPALRKLVEHRFFPSGLRLVTIPFILALILFTFLGPPQNNPANLIVWAVWWPFLIMSIILCGRSWCGYCPMPIISDGLNAYRKNFLPVPDVLLKYGVWIGIAGFGFILLAEHVSHMFTVAYATSILLLGILGGNILTNALFGKRAWCKHICPLGKMVAETSALSLIELESNSTVCSSQCQTHDCVRDGNCPMGLHPSAAAISKDCILCMSCLKRCKHQAVRINARLPWSALLGGKKEDFPGAFFAVFLAGLVLATKLPTWGPINDFITRHYADHLYLADTIISLATGVVFTALAFLASGFPRKDSWQHNFSVSGYAYLFLQYAGLSQTIPTSWITPNLGTLKALIPLITLAGGISSLVMLARLAAKNGVPKSTQRFHEVILSFTTLVFLAIL
ncbi:MAG: cyclic nucleotide-binding domain-containing protein [Desulfobacterales bacterium]